VRGRSIRCEGNQVRRFAEANSVTKKDLHFWIGMAAWIAPPLLLLVVWAIF
jgi:hypothetical protein